MGKEASMHHTQDHLMDNNDTLRNALAGAVAGAIAVWLMDRFDWYAYQHGDPAARQRTDAVRPDGMDPGHVAANKVARAFGTELEPASARAHTHPAGLAVHYSLGIGPAALYGALKERMPAIGMGQGSLYGLALFLLHDEGLNAMTGLAARPRAYPWQAHARGLVAHLIYGVATDTIFGLLKAPRRQPSYSDSDPYSSAWQEETDVGWDMAPAYMPAEGQTAETQATRH